MFLRAGSGSNMAAIMLHEPLLCSGPAWDGFSLSLISKGQMLFVNPGLGWSLCPPMVVPAGFGLELHPQLLLLPVLFSWGGACLPGPSPSLSCACDQCLDVAFAGQMPLSPTWLCPAAETSVRNKRGAADENSAVDDEHKALYVLQHWEEMPGYGYKLVPEHVEIRSLYNPENPGLVQVRCFLAQHRHCPGKDLWGSWFPAPGPCFPPHHGMNPMCCPFLDGQLGLCLWRLSLL